MTAKTTGTKATTSLTAIQWQPAGLNTTDWANLQELIKSPTANVPLADSCRIENGILYYPGAYRNQGIPLVAGDWICVDGAGWPVIVPNAVMTNASTGWTHS